MKKNNYIFLLVTLLTNCNNSEEKYFDKPVEELRQGKEYKQTYNNSLKELKNGTFDYHYDFWVKEGNGSIEELVSSPENRTV